MITLELITITGLKFSEDVYEVIMPTPDGQIAVFPNHMPLISLASPGILSIRKREKDPDDSLVQYAIDGGVIEINDRRVRILVDEASHDSEIVEKDAEQALQLAKEEASKARDQLSLDKATQLVAVQQARLHLAQLKKRKRR
jgi:F-type H+-transporting ATPase subunit epsilon